MPLWLYVYASKHTKPCNIATTGAEVPGHYGSLRAHEYDDDDDDVATFVDSSFAWNRNLEVSCGIWTVVYGGIRRGRSRMRTPRVGPFQL